MRFMQLPYLPCISRFNGEDHRLKVTASNNEIDRTKDISELNRFFLTQNAQVMPQKSKLPPSMKYAGIKKKTFGKTPGLETAHIFGHWVGASKHSSNNMVHIFPKRRLPYWRDVHNFFDPNEDTSESD